VSPTSILFLDIDGVMNSTKFMVAQGAAGKWDHPNWPCDDWSNQIDPIAVGLLSEIVVRTGAQIVISSSWRIARPHVHIWRDLRRHGFVGEVIDATPHCSGEPRAFEIVAWLKHRIESVTLFAIVDDDIDAGFGMEDRFVRTEHAHGLTRSDTDKLIAILCRTE
jgi:hypothetical protein